jgi:hypothetical protein
MAVHGHTRPARLLSGTASIARILTTVREPVISTVQLRELLAAEFRVEAICPVTTLRALRALAGDPAAHPRVTQRA